MEQSAFRQQLEVDPEARWFWDGVAAKELRLQRCHKCGRISLPPTPGCPGCGDDDQGWITSPGRGTVYSWIVCHRALDPAFADDIPYTIVAVDLAEGPRLYGRLIGDGDVCPAAEMSVRIEFTTLRNGEPYWIFRASKDTQNVGAATSIRNEVILSGVPARQKTQP